MFHQSKPVGKALLGVLLILLLAVVLTACSGPESKSGGAGGRGESASTGGGDLVISLADITEQASFYPVEVSGTSMEVIAVKAPDGTVRTAFNTCQICYDSGRGYYEQSGNSLVCQNCGNRFPMSHVEVEAGGCNPWPIFAGDKTVTEESITISRSFLEASDEIFASWKVAY